MPLAALCLPTAERDDASAVGCLAPQAGSSSCSSCLETAVSGDKLLCACAQSVSHSHCAGCSPGRSHRQHGTEPPRLFLHTRPPGGTSSLGESTAPAAVLVGWEHMQRPTSQHAHAIGTAAASTKGCTGDTDVSCAGIGLRATHCTQCWDMGNRSIHHAVAWRRS